MFMGSNKLFNNDLRPKKEFITTEGLTGKFNMDEAILEYNILESTESYDILKSCIQLESLCGRYDNHEIIEEVYNSNKKSISEFFKNIIIRIGEFFRKAFTYIRTYMGDFNKFIDKNKDLIKSANPNFDAEIFQYTFDDNIPDLSVLDEAVVDYEKNKNDIMSKISNSNTIVNDMISNFKSMVSNESLDRLRAKIIGKHGGISEEYYLEEIKRIFRSGDSSPEKVTIDKNKLNKIVDEFSKFTTLLNNVKKQKIKIDTVLNTMKSFFDSKIEIGYSNSSNGKTINVGVLNLKDDKLYIKKDRLDYNAKAAELLSMLVKYEFKYAQKLSIMVTNVFFEKIKALEEALKQYKSVIRHSLFNKNKDMESSEEKDETPEVTEGGD